MDVTFIASGKDQDCGINDYTTSIESALPVESTRIGIKSNSTDIVHYVRKSIDALRSDDPVIHLQHEYGVFGPGSICSWPVIFTLLLINVFTGKRVVITIHTAWDSTTPDPPLIWLKRFYIWLNNRLILLAADHIIFLSERGKERMVPEYNIKNYTLLPHGVQVDPIDITQEQARDDLDWPGEEIVVLPGYIRPQKGYEDFVEAAQRDDRIYAVAGGVRNETYDSYAEEILDDLPSNAIHTGVLDFDEFRKVFVAADVCYLPYEDASQSGILNWAMAHGLPVVGSDLPYFLRLSEETDAVTPTSSVEDALGVFDRYFGDGEARNDQIEAAKQFAEKNSMENIAKEHLKIYRQ